MNPKQKLFCEHYCGAYYGNAYRSAIAAGYSPKYAIHANDRLLSHPEIQDYISELQHGSQAARIATVDEIKAFFTEIMNNPAKATKDRIRAAELLAKTAGAFRDDW